MPVHVQIEYVYMPVHVQIEYMYMHVHVPIVYMHEHALYILIVYLVYCKSAKKC